LLPIGGEGGGGSEIGGEGLFKQKKRGAVLPGAVVKGKRMSHIRGGREKTTHQGKRRGDGPGKAGQVPRKGESIQLTFLEGVMAKKKEKGGKSIATRNILRS